MDIDLIFRIAGIGVVIAVISQLLSKAGREDIALLLAIAGLVGESERNAEYIIPNPFDKRVAKAVAEAVAKAARDTGVARI